MSSQRKAGSGSSPATWRGCSVVAIAQNATTIATQSAAHVTAIVWRLARERSPASYGFCLTSLSFHRFKDARTM